MAKWITRKCMRIGCEVTFRVKSGSPQARSRFYHDRRCRRETAKSRRHKTHAGKIEKRIWQVSEVETASWNANTAALQQRLEQRLVFPPPFQSSTTPAATAQTATTAYLARVRRSLQKCKRGFRQRAARS